jgi:Fur family ferric uptake transcriptional regulator
MHLENATECQPDHLCDACLDKIRVKLSKSGGRVTKERVALMRSICNYDGHFSAEDLQRTLLESGVKVSLPTVYRNLPVLVEAGIIRRTSLLEEASSQAATYEHIYGKPHHDHLLCVGCGARVEFVYPAIEVLQEAVAREHGYELTGHHLELVGLCPACRGNGAGERR